MKKDKLICPCAKISDSNIARDATIDEHCTIKSTVIGQKTVIKERVSLKRVKIGNNSLVNAGTYIENAEIGNGVMIAPNCSIVGVTHDFDSDNGVNSKNVLKKIIIGDNVFIGAGAIILSGSIIQSRAVVGAGSTVASNIPSAHTYIGSPINFKLYPIKKIESLASPQFVNNNIN